MSVEPVDDAVLKKRIAELEVELRARDEFIAALAHELRNPIAPLFLKLDHLAYTARHSADGSISAAWLLPQLDKLSERLRHFMTVLNRLLDVSRVRAGHIDLQMEEVDLVQVLHDITTGFERERAVSGSALSIEAPGELLGTWDLMRAQQIVSNLVSNAIRYGNSQPIEIAIESEGNDAVLRVRDHGVGIPEEEQRRIFDKFERAAASTQGGFGIGLWIVDRLTRAMGGSVSLDSRVGEGSRFIVRLPRTKAGTGS